MSAARYLVLPVLLAATALSCGGGQDPCQVVGCRADAGTPSADAGTTEAGPDGGTVDPLPAGCTTPNEPLKNPEKCLVDSFGAFVSPTGDDGNPGTKAKPFKTIGKALEGTKSRVVVCEGTYKEDISVGRNVELYGGLNCDFSGPGKPTQIESGKSVGLTVSSGTVLLSAVDVVASNGVAAGDSSVGVLAQSGTILRIAGGTIRAGNGAPGKNGESFSNYDTALLQSDPAIKGADGAGQAGGALQTCANLCKEPPSVAVEGGVGGPGGGAGGGPGGTGKTTVPGAPATRGKGGSFDSVNSICGSGLPGASADAAVGGAGAKQSGLVVGTMWTAQRGVNGATGRPGQGGGGGSGGLSSTVGGGGGGGCGGCGGGKGEGGLSGGSSFAVLSLGGALTIEGTKLVAGVGGVGGDGGNGQAGQPGGFGGAPSQSSVGCAGGGGGQGGHGGGGGGGAGGHSAGVGWLGSKPSLTGVTAQTAPAAAVGGKPGDSGTDNPTPATAGEPGKVGTEVPL